MYDEESENIFIYESIDKLVCPSCEVKGTLTVIRKKIDEKKWGMQIRCMNPECHSKCWKPFIHLAPMKTNKWYITLPIIEKGE